MSVRARVERITYPRRTNLTLSEYKICVCSAPMECIPKEYQIASKRKMTFSAKGYDIPFTMKYDLILNGKWIVEKDYGLTLKVTSASIAPPSDEEGVINYLVMFVEGCSKASAKRIYKAFGSATIMVLRDAPEKLYEIPHLRKKSIEKMISSFKKTKGMIELTSLLSPFNIGKRRIEYVFNMFGPDSADIIRKSPFSLQYVRGIGFETMEMIAQKHGTAFDDPLRIKAALKHCIYLAEHGSKILFDNPVLQSGGNLYINQIELHNAAFKLLNQRSEKLVTRKKITDVMCEMAKLNELLGENKNAYLPNTFYNERKCAKNIVTILTNSTIRRYTGSCAEQAIQRAEQTMEIELSKNQRDAVRCVLANPLSVITGGAGTGKSTVLKVILCALQLLGERPDDVTLAAPTGKAAIRMTEVTGYPASTLHKALGLMSEEDKWRSEEEFELLEAKFIVVDEFSMCDMDIAYRLFAQINLQATRVLLVGDVGQLPSVGAGDVLNQIIQSTVVPTVKLNTVFRQAQESNIIRNSKNIADGVKYVVFEKDCSLYESFDEDDIMKFLLKIYVEKSQKFGIDETIVLCPIKGNNKLDSDNSANIKFKKICTKYINAQIQAMINPPAFNKAEAKIFGNTYRVGDKVIQVKNRVFKMYNSSSVDGSGTEVSVDVCNGDVGIIKSIIKDGNGYCFYVDFSDNRLIKLDEEALKDIELAYCLTIHKSQGSEYASVILPLPLKHYHLDDMMNRNLIYTAFTRAKKDLTVIGDTSVLYKAIDNVNVSQRNTVLAEKIKKYYKEEAYESSTH